MPKVDLSKTQELADLLIVERDKRDVEWIRRFYEVVGDAGLATTPDQVLQGPDGFSYFVLNMPAPRRNFEPLSISHVLDFCLENSLGIVIEPQPEPPEWVIPFGLLWSKKQFGKFDPNFETEPESAAVATPIRTSEVPTHLAGKQAVLVAQPSHSYFPEYARNAVRKFLRDQGIHNPGVLLLSNPAQEPPETIAFSIFAEDFADKDQFRNFMQHLAWFFPPHYRLSSIGKNSEIAKSFQPL